MTNAIHEGIATLQSLDRPGLLARWTEAFGRSPPKRMSRDLLLRSLAYDLQQQLEGGLSKAARRRLGILPGSNDMPGSPVKSAASHLRPGTYLIREWRGEVHKVVVRDDGFEYRGAHYASLSQIARTVTGTRWSGPLFFGLRNASSGKERSTDAT